MSEAHRSEAQLQRLKSSFRGILRGAPGRLRERARPSLARASDRVSEAFTQQVVSLASSLADPDFLRWGSSLTHSAATVYHHALDVEHVGAQLAGLRKGVPELLSAGLGAVGLVFLLQRGDLERLSELLGSMGVTALLSANPVLGLGVVATTGYAYWQAKRRGEQLSLDSLSAVRGAALAGSSAAVFTVMTGPVAVKLVVALAVTGVLRKLTVRSPASTRELGPVLPAQRASVPFRCDRALVEQMLL